MKLNNKLIMIHLIQNFIGGLLLDFIVDTSILSIYDKTKLIGIFLYSFYISITTYVMYDILTHFDKHEKKLALSTLSGMLIMFLIIHK